MNDLPYYFPCASRHGPGFRKARNPNYTNLEHRNQCTLVESKETLQSPSSTFPYLNLIGGRTEGGESLHLDASQQIWYSINCLLKHLAAPAADVVWDMPDWKQTIFAQRPPRKFKKVSKYWTLLKGIALWTIWISRNDTSFNNDRWSHEKIKKVIWQGLCDYGRSTWQKIQAKVQQNPTSIGAALVRFDSMWLRPTICTREDLKVRWVKNWPTGIG
jgi:hypothetical protein